MRLWNGIVTAVVLLLGLSLIAVNVMLYVSWERQKVEVDSLVQQQQIEAQVTSNQFRYQQQQIERLSKDLEKTQEELEDQKADLQGQKEFQTAQKHDTASIKSSLAGVQAEADAVKQQVKAWQKDYSSVLAEIEKKADDAQTELRGLRGDLAGLNIPGLKDNIASLKLELDKVLNAPPAPREAPNPVLVDPTSADKESSRDFNGT